MKGQENKNSKNKILFIILMVGSSFLLAINFIPLFVGDEGIYTDYVSDLNNDRITFVNKSSPDINFGALPLDSVIGNCCETYIHYNLEKLPKNTKEMHFFLWDIEFSEYPPPVEDLEINLILVGSNWNVSDITWNNKPKHEEIIDTVNISQIRQSPFLEYYDLGKTLRLTDFLNEYQQNEISFCINITNNNFGLNVSAYLFGIHLIYVYDILLISYTTIISSAIIIVMLIGTVIYLKKNVNSPDYQLITILLWIFIFIEIPFIQYMLLEEFFYELRISFLSLIPWMILGVIQITRKIKNYLSYRKSSQ